MLPRLPRRILTGFTSAPSVNCESESSLVPSEPSSVVLDGENGENENGELQM